jgi:hypothetical protein
LLGACAGGESARDGGSLGDDGGAVFDSNDGPEADALAWRIVLGAVSAAERADPQAALDRLGEQTGLSGLELGERGGDPLIVFGRYAAPDSREAQRDFERIRGVTVGGERPFAQAFFLPPNLEAARGRQAAYDLRNARERFGRDAVYTLQVGMYARGDNRPASTSELIEFRRLAERAVEQLRAEGQPAFYYHGPTGSMVTVGLYGPEDHDPATNPPLESARLRAVREQFPNSLLNGLGVKTRARTPDGRVVERLQASFLVAVPN